MKTQQLLKETTQLCRLQNHSNVVFNELLAVLANHSVQTASVTLKLVFFRP